MSKDLLIHDTARNLHAGLRCNLPQNLVEIGIGCVDRHLAIDILKLEPCRTGCCHAHWWRGPCVAVLRGMVQRHSRRIGRQGTRLCRSLRLALRLALKLGLTHSRLANPARCSTLCQDQASAPRREAQSHSPGTNQCQTPELTLLRSPLRRQQRSPAFPPRATISLSLRLHTPRSGAGHLAGCALYYTQMGSKAA